MPGGSFMTHQPPSAEQVTFWTKRDGQWRFEDTSGLHRFRRPRLPLDLNHGYPDTFIRQRTDYHAPVEIVAQALLTAGVPWSACDVVTFRSNMNKLAMTLENLEEAWSINAYRPAEGPLFLDSMPRDDGADQMYPNADRYMYFGYKFEQLCTQPDHTEPPVVDATAEYATVVRRSFRELRVMMAAEVDCEHREKGARTRAGDPSYLELKTCKVPQDRRARWTLARYKYPRWWVQSWLAGVPMLAVGERDENGRVGTIRMIKTVRLPVLSSRLKAKWNPERLIAFASDALAWMHARASRSAGKHVRFTYDPETQCIDASEMLDGDLPARISKLL